MKKVLFVCLISLSMCLSVPAGQNDTAQQAVTPTVTPTPAHVDNPSATAPAPDAHPAAAATNATSKVPTEKNTPPAPTVPTSTSEKSTTTTPAEKKDTDGNKTDANKVDPTKDKTNATTPAPTVPASATTVHPDDKGKSPTTTPKVPTSSLKPSDVPSKEGGEEVKKARGFDGASFIGGIILTLGLLAIGFMGFKYYKNQTERNYHTL